MIFGLIGDHVWRAEFDRLAARRRSPTSHRSMARQTARVWRRSTDFPLSPPHLPPPAPSSPPTSSTQNARILARDARSKLTPPPSCAGNIPSCPHVSGAEVGRASASRLAASWPPLSTRARAPPRARAPSASDAPRPEDRTGGARRMLLGPPSEGSPSLGSWFIPRHQRR